jgi:hypothetical protein
MTGGRAQFLSPLFGARKPLRVAPASGLRSQDVWRRRARRPVIARQRWEVRFCDVRQRDASSA